ncbi:MAG: hypothetical protein HEP71_06765 [Roseivirga sp.]|nr:hypothetical protein [Roseivirga sp.]
MNKISLTLVLCHFFFLSTARQKQVIPLDLSTNRPIVEVKINGQGPYTFIFDTGSSTNVIDNQLAETLGLKVVGEDPLRSQGSSTLVSKRYEASDISITGAGFSKKGTLNGIALRSMLPVDGIIGGPFASDYLVTLDYPGSRLVLEKAELNKNDAGVTEFLQKPRVINLHIAVNGLAVETHLDTGNPGGFSLPYALKDQLTYKEEPVEDGEIRTPVATYKKWRAQLAGEIKVGEVIYKDPKINLIEGFEQANIGYGVIMDLQTIIDRKNHLIAFKKPDSDASGSMGDEITDYSGTYGDKLRSIFKENGDLYIQRGSSPKLKMALLEEDLYQITFPQPVRNELPKVRFERNEQGKVRGMTFVYKDGREEFTKKDN